MAQDNLLDVLNRSGISVLWKGNDGGDKSIAKRVNKVELNPKSDQTLCDGTTCYDMALVKDLDENIRSMDGNRIIVLHIIGSLAQLTFAVIHQRWPSLNQIATEPISKTALLSR